MLRYPQDTTAQSTADRVGVVESSAAAPEGPRRGVHEPHALSQLEGQESQDDAFCAATSGDLYSQRRGMRVH
jgi:hypothetical protein